VAQRHAIAARRRQQGSAAEELAARYLAAQGLKLLARNVRCRAGEIDLVCGDGKYLVMVEVRQRTRRDFGGAAGSITVRKRQKIIRAARFLLRALPRWRLYPVRFDVVAVEGRPSGDYGLEWIKDAFRADEARYFTT
jgi:putative endonuclease